MCADRLKYVKKKLLEIGKNRFKLTCICLNILYSVCGLLLIIASVWYQHNHNTLDAHYSVQTFTAALGVVVLPIAIFGVVTQMVQKAERLFFIYVIALGLTFLLFTSLSAMCLACKSSDLIPLLVRRWAASSNQTKEDVQHMLHCCGFSDPNLSAGDSSGMGHPPCWQMTCCATTESQAACCKGGAGESGAACPCSTCVAPLDHNFNHLVKLSGVLGLVTALFVLFGVVYMVVHFVQENRRIVLEMREASEGQPDPPAVSYDRF